MKDVKYVYGFRTMAFDRHIESFFWSPDEVW